MVRNNYSVLRGTIEFSIENVFISKLITFQIRNRERLILEIWMFSYQLILYYFRIRRCIWMQIKFCYKKCIWMWDKDTKRKLIENIFIQKIIIYKIGFLEFSMRFGRLATSLQRDTGRTGPVKNGSETGPTPVHGDWPVGDSL